MKKMSDLESRVLLLEKELELEKKKRELFQTQLEHTMEWKKEREKDFQDIAIIAESLREDEKYREENK